MLYRLICVFLLVVCGVCAVLAAPVTHPNLLLNKAEIAQVKEKIAKYPWAAELFEKTKERAKDNNNTLEIALCYAFTGEKGYADRARGFLLQQAAYWTPQYEKVDLNVTPEFGAWGSWGAHAWIYDLVWDTCSEEERQAIERYFRTAAKVIMDGDTRWTTTPNLIFGKRLNIGMIGYVLGNEEIISYALNDMSKFGPSKSGFYPVLDNFINDGYFWGETPIYALHYDIHAMFSVAEAARHYDGTDLFSYVSKKTGGSIKSLVDSYILLGFPLERTGIGKGALRMATYGDGSTSYGPSGGMGDLYLTDENFRTVLELAYAHYKAPGYAWMLSLPPNRITYGGVGGRSAWSYVGLTHGVPLPENPTPPPAPSGIYPSQGLAMLRADESPNYWTSGALAAMVRLGKAIGHGHNDFYSLVLHGKGRMLYPDINVVNYEPTYLNWTHEGIAHSTLLVDHQSPVSGEFTTSTDFTPDVKFFAINGSAYKGVQQTRRLLLTRDYLADVFHAADGQGEEHTFDWVLHGLGRLYPGNPAAYRPSDALVPYYWWVDNERGRTADATWQADWIQRTAGITEGLQFGKEWFNQEVGTRMTMLGVKDTAVYYGDGPITIAPPFHRIDGNPEPAAPMVVARRQGKAATFTAIHEPYEGAPKLRNIRRLAEDNGAIVMSVETPDYTDFLCLAFDDNAHLLGSAEAAFAFTGYAWLRVQNGAIIARGKIRSFQVPVPGKKIAVTLNGQETNALREGPSVVYGQFPSWRASEPTRILPAEYAAALHYWFMPEEVHLSALQDTDERQLTMHLRSVGDGQAAGRLQIVAPAGITIDPPAINVPALAPGQERVITLTVKKTTALAKGLYTLRFVPAAGTPAAAQAVTASVGVVITIDRRIPMSAQYVIRAPGYTTKVDNYSGVSYYLLDADGHRRHGVLHNSNFTFGIPSVEGASRFRTPCGFVWIGENSLTIGADPARLRYTYYEDRIVYTITPPSNPTKTFKMWMGTFDALKDPIHNGKQDNPYAPIVADWFYFPHPVYRQGILIMTPPQTPLEFPKAYGLSVGFPLKINQDVTLKFATPEEVEALKAANPNDK